MERFIRRNFHLSQREVHEAINAWLRQRDLPAPQYIGDTPTTNWHGVAEDGVRIEWTEKDEVPA